jgi:hypothetical protein
VCREADDAPLDAAGVQIVELEGAEFLPPSVRAFSSTLCVLKSVQVNLASASSHFQFDTNQRIIWTLPAREDHHFIGRYRSVSPEEVANLAVSAGFTDVRVRPSADTGYYQPIVTAVRP